MGLTELPSALFCMKNVGSLRLEDNKLCSLPSEIAHMTTLEELWVRRSKRVDLDLTSVQVDFNRLTSLPPELGSLTNLKWLDVRRLKPTPDGT
jgi:Leucine-rich repeat (LRR) protein